MIPSACPGEPLLQDYHLGQTSDADAERLEGHLTGCPRCLAALEALHPEDALLATFRAQARKPRPANARLDQLRQQVRELARRRPMPSETESGTLGDRTGTPFEMATQGFRKDIGATLAPPAEQAGPDEFAPAGPLALGNLTQLGPYRILETLGAGGMGVVLKAEDVSLKRLVALKVMQPGLACNEQAKQRFLQEARAMAALAHDHIVTVYQVGEDRGIPFLAMPLLQGETLEQRLKREACLPLGESLRVGRETALGLAAAHERGMIHRDIKPGNLWLEAVTGRVKILDFGLARGAGEGDPHLTREGTVLGTPAFMAPEQAGGAVDQRADLFSLGCVLYRVTTGRLPFAGSTLLEVLKNIAVHDPRPPHELSPEVPPEIGTFILRMLAKDRNERPASAGVVARVLETLQQKHAPLPVAVPLFGPSPARAPTEVIPGPGIPVALPVGAEGADTVNLAARKRRPWWASRRNAVAAAAVLLLLGGGAFAWHFFGPPGDDRIARHEDDKDDKDDHGRQRPGDLPKGRRPLRKVPEDLVLSLPRIESGKPLEENAYVSRPAVIKGVRSWLLNTSANEMHFTGLVNLGDEYLGLAYANGYWYFWDWIENKFVVAPRGGNYSAVSPDRVYTALANGNAVDVYKGEAVQPTHTLKGHAGKVSSALFSPDGRYLVSADTTGDVHFWQVRDGRRVGRCELGPVALLGWSHDGRTLAAVTNPRIVLVDFPSGKVHKTLTTPFGMTAARWAPDEQLFAVLGEGRAHLLEVDTGKIVHTLDRAATGSTIAWSLDGTMVAFAGPDRNALVYDVSGKEPKLLRDFRGHAFPLYSVLFAPDGQTLVSSGKDGSVRFWDLKKDQPRGSLVHTLSGWFAVSAEGHYRGQPEVEPVLFYRAATEPDDEVVQLKPAEFAKRFGWKNNPDFVRLIDFDAFRKYRSGQDE